MTSFRYPNERFTLVVTLLLIGLLGVVAAGTTFCIVPILAVVFGIFAYLGNESMRNDVMQNGLRVDRYQTPGVAALCEDCTRRLRARNIEFYLAKSRELNAFTFGLSNPKVVVIYTSLLEAMDEDELRFIIGHEVGHVVLGHTWLNSLVGGMAGIPTSILGAVLLNFAFRWWNRACEYSADRAGLLACGSLTKAITALVQLEAGDLRTQAEFRRALALIEKQDDSLENTLVESLSTHPLIIRRIKELQKYAASSEYRQVQAQALAAR